MNDKPAAAEAAAFDPAAHGWEAIVNHTAFGDLVGPIWQRPKGEPLRFGLVVAPKHLNRAGILHGGMLMTLADQVMAMTGRATSEAKRHATIELNIQFVDGVKLGEFVEAEAEVVRATRSLVFMRATMKTGTRIVASTNGIWKIMER
jgi:uncharacterized protein (TIGR00369 family)